MTYTPTPEKNIYWIIFQNNCLLIDNSETDNKLLKNTLVTPMQAMLKHQHKLAQINEYEIHCAELSTEYLLNDNITALPIRKALELLGTDWYGSVTKGMSIINWDKNHKYCGRCGSLTMHKSGTFERSCSNCNLIFYPRISPSIIVLIKKDKEILMARSPHFVPGAYGLIAGFVESGESIEDAVHREVAEEVGIKIKNLKFFGSQSWPFPDSLMIAFTAEYESGDLAINYDEIESAGWYRYDNMPGKPSISISIAHKLIAQFITEQTRVK